MTDTIKRVLITGAAGFIGSRVVVALQNDGYDVGIIIRNESDTFRLNNVIDKVLVFHCDIRDGEEVASVFGQFKPDAVLHLVAYYAVEENVPRFIGIMVDTNVKGAFNLLDAARIHGVKLFVNTSTTAVYIQKDRPLTESDPVGPQNLYAVTKLQAEEACQFYALNYGVSGITLRLFPPYGPGDHERRLMPYVIKSLLDRKSPALTTGYQKWDFVYVDDIVDAYRAVLRAYPFKVPYDIINIGTGNPISIREVVNDVLQMTGAETELSWGTVPHRKQEVWYNSANITKAKEELGWEPRTDIRTGLRRTIDSLMSPGKK